MLTALITHSACLEHDTGVGHPERPARLLAVIEALDGFDLLRGDAPLATVEQLVRVHRESYVRALLSVRLGPGERAALDPDTVISEGSVEAALRAAGGAIAAVDLVMDRRAEAVFVAVRPPGHHAERARGMGFCLFNNVAVAAAHARARWGLSRVAVADFDVHHGNGTQDAFADDPDLFLASSHQSPFYPGTGRAEVDGVAGNIVNAPLPPGSGSAEFQAAWQDRLLPALDAFAPELVLVSAGFDAHKADPLAGLQLETEDFAWITAELGSLTRRHGRGIVSLLEGGYDLEALAACAKAHVEAYQVL